MGAAARRSAMTRNHWDAANEAWVGRSRRCRAARRRDGCKEVGGSVLKASKEACDSSLLPSGKSAVSSLLWMLIVHDYEE